MTKDNKETKSNITKLPTNGEVKDKDVVLVVEGEATGVKSQLKQDLNLDSDGEKLELTELLRVSPDKATLDKNFVLKFIEDQMEKLTKGEMLAIQEDPSIFSSVIFETKETFSYGMYIDFTLGYVVQMTNMLPDEDGFIVSDLIFYDLNGDVYQQSTDDTHGKLPLPITLEAMLQFFPHLKSKNKDFYDEASGTYTIKELRDSLNRALKVTLNRKENGLYVDYSCQSENSLQLLGYLNLPKSTDADPEFPTDWVVLRQEYILEPDEEDLKRAEKYKEENPDQ